MARATWMWGLVLAAGACRAPAAPVVPPSATPATPEPAPSAEIAAPASPDVAPTPTVAGDTDEVRAALARRDVSWTDAPTRIVLGRRGPIRLHPEGDDLGLADLAPLQFDVRLWVVTDGAQPRVAVDAGGIRLLVHVRRDDAQPVVLTDAPLRRAATRGFADPPRRAHLILHPGAWVHVLETRTDSVRVTHQAEPDAPVWRGWIDADVLGTTVTLVDEPYDEDEAVAQMDQWWTVRADTDLRMRPRGTRMHRLWRGQSVRAIGRPKDGHRLVAFTFPCNRTVTYVGFVPTGDIFQPNYGMAHGCGWGPQHPPPSFGSQRDAPKLTLKAGRFLVDPEHETLVGCVAKDTEVADLGEGRYGIATLWGAVPVRLADPEIEGACAEDET